MTRPERSMPEALDIDLENRLLRITGPITFYGHKGEWERFKILAEMKGKSASELLTEMIRRAVKRGAK